MRHRDYLNLGGNDMYLTGASHSPSYNSVCKRGKTQVWYFRVVRLQRPFLSCVKGVAYKTCAQDLAWYNKVNRNCVLGHLLVFYLALTYIPHL